MDGHSQETLRMVEENDDELTRLWICGGIPGSGVFTSTDGDDFSRLGAAIGENTHLQYLEVELYELVTNNNEFYDGLKKNSSIHKLKLHCHNSNIAGRVGRKILEAY